MKLSTGIFYLILILIFQPGMSNAGDKLSVAASKKYTELWLKVDSLISEGLERRALTVAEDIYKLADAEKNPSQLLKALIYRLKLEDHLNEDPLIKNIYLLEEETAKAEYPQKPVLHSLLAELYWRYYELNRHRFHSRSKTTSVTNGDISTWDLQKISNKCMSHYDASLSKAAISKSIPVNLFDDVILAGSPEEARKFRPTLYDFLAHRAIDFYMNTESGLTMPAENFSMNDVSFLAEAGEFLNLVIKTSDTASFKYKAILLLREILNLHASDKDPGAFIDADLKRIDFVYQNMSHEHKDSLYESLLHRIVIKHRESPLSAEIYFRLAAFYEQKGNLFQEGENEHYKWDLVKAMNYCDSAIQTHPGTRGAVYAANLRKSIEQSALSFITEEYNPAGSLFRARISYKNVKTIHFRIIPDISQSIAREELYGDQFVKLILDQSPLEAWSVLLPEDPDMQHHSLEAAIPSLKNGRYILLMSDNPDFSFEKSVIAHGSIRITNMSLMSRRLRNGVNEFFVLDRVSGKALEGVNADVLVSRYNRSVAGYTEKIAASYSSDKEGSFRITQLDKEDRNFRLRLVKGSDTLFSRENFYQYIIPDQSAVKINRTVFFTDRSVYRPGQTVFFKALLLSIADGIPHVEAMRNTTVKFFDVNNQLISELKLQSNDFGTVQGVFTIPQGILNGVMRISDERGSVSISVEEYKRPKFECRFLPPEGFIRAGDEIEIRGSANSFSGFPIDGAKVRYRVTRMTRMPPWCYWFRSVFPSLPEQEILSGETTTDSSGTFRVRFTAIPDQSIERKYDPVFNYKIIADITDVNQETRSTETVLSAGYTSMELNTDLPDAIDGASTSKFKIHARNFSGTKIASGVGLKIFRIGEPQGVTRKREWPKTDKFIYTQREYKALFPLDVYKDEDNFLTWDKDEEIWSKEINTGTDSICELSGAMESGFYLLEGSATDSFGENVKLMHYFTVYNEAEKRFPRKQISWIRALKDDARPGEENRVLISSAMTDVQVLLETESDQKIVSRKWITLNAEQKIIRIPVLEEYRGNFSVHINFVKDNRFYRETIVMKVPWDNKELVVSYETFRNTLDPGSPEKWKLKLSDKSGGKAMAEMLLSMYDASLDVFRKHEWRTGFYRGNYPSLSLNPHTFTLAHSNIHTLRFVEFQDYPPRVYDQLNWFGYEGYGSILPVLYETESIPLVSGKAAARGVVMAAKDMVADGENRQAVDMSAGSGAENSQAVQIRKNLSETAFFFPQLMADEDGTYSITFNSPEALTKWKLQLFAHTKDLKYVYEEKELVTSKELMITPNFTRFLREGDTLTVSCKINSLMDVDKRGTAKLHFLDAITMRNLDTLFGNLSNVKHFSIVKGGSSSVRWTFQVPDNIPAVIMQVSAKTDSHSDGEEHLLPVLSNRQLVIESLPLWTRGGTMRNFEMTKLTNNVSSSLRHHRLRLEFVSNPVWTIVQALPYLMEYPYQCSEQTFSRFYANSLATHIANSTPEIRQVFNNLRTLSPESFMSKLEKNHDLKSVILAETPWVLDAKDEKERKERVALLFDINRMSVEQSTAMMQLRKMQNPDGSWPWFDGMRGDRFITQHIVTGILQLLHLQVLTGDVREKTAPMIQAAIEWLDSQARDEYNKLIRDSVDLEKYIPGMIQLHYLYMMSFDRPGFVKDGNSKHHEYFLKQASKHWTQYKEYGKGMISLVSYRAGNKELAGKIIMSLRESAIRSDEMGMYWKNNSGGYFWSDAPVETQSLLIEAFTEAGKDESSAEEMKIWLLKQKQTRNWRSTKATAMACYAMLMGGANLTGRENIYEISVNGRNFNTNDKSLNQEAGSGSFSYSWNQEEIRNDMGRIQVRPLASESDTTETRISWGAMYWQYFEDLDKISASQNSAISVRKDLFVERYGPAGAVTERITDNTPLVTGDKVIVRIELRSDRDMEYLHMKDQRAAGLEPVNVLSSYKWQDGLGYYESTRDASTDFFIDFLPKGTYVFEYSLRAFQSGSFSGGLTTIQNMYAPEFSANSKGGLLQISSGQ